MGQAPRGELKEKSRGDNSSMTEPWTGQANFSEKISSLAALPWRYWPTASAAFQIVSASSSARGSTSTIAIPSDWRRQVVRESVSRSVRSGLTIRRSTTISISWATLLLSLIVSLRSWTTPSTRTRTNPWELRLESRLMWVPFLLRTTGASS